MGVRVETDGHEVYLRRCSRSPGTRTWNLRIKSSLLHRYHESHGKGCLFDRRHYAHPCGRRSILEAGVVGAESPEIVPEGERSGQMDGVDHPQLGRP